jgi:hypothetical protein
MTTLTKKSKGRSSGTILSVLAMFMFLASGGLVYGNSNSNDNGHKPAAHYQAEIAKEFKTLEDNLLLMEVEGKSLTENVNSFLSVAEFSVKLKSDISTVLEAIRNQAKAGENFEQNYKILIEEVDAFSNALPISGGSPGDKVKANTELEEPSDKTAAYGVRVSNVNAALQQVTRSISVEEQQAIVKKAETALRGEFQTFGALFELRIENATKTVDAGALFAKNMTAFAEADKNLVESYNKIKEAVNNLKIANRIAKKEPVIAKEYLQKLEQAALLLEQAKIVALRQANEVTKALNLFNRRNKQVRGTLVAAETEVRAIRTRHPSFINEERLNVLIALMILLGSILYFIHHAEKGTKIFIRKIAGLAALEDAVGRATEMGRPVLFVSGIRDIDDVQTLAGISILASVASTTAEYDTRLFVPCCAPLAYSMAQEVVKEAYLKAGRPDAYCQDDIRFLTSDQFGFVAGVSGIMVREEVAATFYLGKFFAESLILAETGNSIGAIQIAGTAETAQLPFFVAACDYTLIGEELFAASAYLSGEPRLLGSLKGQDVSKAIMIISIMVGSVIQILISYGHLPESMSVAKLFN